MDGDIRELMHDLHARHVARGAHVRIHTAVQQRIAADLAVVSAPADMVGGPADEDVAVRCQAVHAVILAVEGKELAGQIPLVHVPPQLRAEIVEAALFILGDEAGASEIRNEIPDKIFVADDVHGLDPARAQVESLGVLQDLHARRPFSVGAHRQLFRRGTGDGVLIPVGQLRQQGAVGKAAVDLVPQLLPQRVHGDVQQREFLDDQRLARGLDAHHQQQLQDHVAPRPHKIGNDLRDRLGVCLEDIGVVRHIVLQQVIGRDHVDEALFRGPGGKVPD